MAKHHVVNLFRKSLDLAHLPKFDRKTMEAEAASAILEFKQSQFNALDYVNAKDVEKWGFSTVQNGDRSTEDR